VHPAPKDLFLSNPKGLEDPSGFLKRKFNSILRKDKEKKGCWITVGVINEYQLINANRGHFIHGCKNDSRLELGLEFNGNFKKAFRKFIVTY
jgi:hypothetical protein